MKFRVLLLCAIALLPIGARATISFVAHPAAYTNGSSPVTSASYTPTTAGNQLLMFTANDASIANTVTGTQGTYSLVTPPGRTNDADGDGMAVFSNPTAVASSQTYTMTATGSGAGTVYGVLVEYGATNSLSNGVATVRTGITSGSSILGAAVTVPTGSTLVAIIWASLSATDLISNSNGTARWQIHDGVGGFTVADYTGAGSSVTPTFTSTQATGDYIIVQIMLNPAGGGAVQKKMMLLGIGARATPVPFDPFAWINRRRQIAAGDRWKLNLNKRAA